MPQPVNKPGELVPGDLFEDCRYHPCLCTEGNSSKDVDGVLGISLVNGTPSGCSIFALRASKVNHRGGRALEVPWP
jgi:hypothetical protein